MNTEKNNQLQYIKREVHFAKIALDKAKGYSKQQLIGQIEALELFAYKMYNVDINTVELEAPKKIEFNPIDNEIEGIRIAFENYGINGIKNQYFRRSTYKPAARKYITDIVERLAFNDNGAESEMAAELINKY